MSKRPRQETKVAAERKPKLRRMSTRQTHVSSSESDSDSEPEVESILKFPTRLSNVGHEWSLAEIGPVPVMVMESTQLPSGISAMIVEYAGLDCPASVSYETVQGMVDQYYNHEKQARLQQIPSQDNIKVGTVMRHCKYVLAYHYLVRNCVVVYRSRYNPKIVGVVQPVIIDVRKDKFKPWAVHPADDEYVPRSLDKCEEFSLGGDMFGLPCSKAAFSSVLEPDEKTICQHMAAVPKKYHVRRINIDCLAEGAYKDGPLEGFSVTEFDVHCSEVLGGFDCGNGECVGNWLAFPP